MSADKKPLQLSRDLAVRIPLLPNFITIGDVSKDVRDFTDAELEQIGARWTEDLIAYAKKRRVLLRDKS